MTFSNYDTAIAAAVAGQGVALGRQPLIDALLKRRALVAPLKAAQQRLRAQIASLQEQADDLARQEKGGVDRVKAPRTLRQG